MQIARHYWRYSHGPAVALLRASLLLLLALAVSSCRRPQKTDAPTAPAIRILTANELGTSLKESRAPVTLVHVWATWCAPCREEFPSVLRLRQDYTNRGLDVILVSADPPAAPAPVARYLVEQGVHSPTLLIDNPNAEFINTLCTNWSGALPASFFFSPGGRLQRWWEGKAEYARYRETVAKLLEPVQTRR